VTFDDDSPNRVLLLCECMRGTVAVADWIQSEQANNSVFLKLPASDANEIRARIDAIEQFDCIHCGYD